MRRPPLPALERVQNAIGELENADTTRPDYTEFVVEQALTLLREVAAHLGAPAKPKA